MPDLLISVIIGTDMEVFHGGVGTSLAALLPPPLQDGGVPLGAPRPGWAVPALPCKALAYLFGFFFPGDWGFIKS